MTITLLQLIALLPLLIVGLTVVAVMLAIAWRRNHTLSASLTVAGLALALFSTTIALPAGPLDVTRLLHVDSYALFYMLLTLLASIATALFAWGWLHTYPDNKEEFWLLLLLSTLGALVLTCASHLAAVFIGIELLSIPLFGLAGYAFQRERSLEAGIKYMVLSAAASSFLLFGMALIYAKAGQLDFAGLKHLLAYGALSSPVLLAGLGLMIVGLGFKLSLAPFHLWTPDVYQGAPGPVALYLATVSKVAIFAMVMRLVLSVPLTDSYPAIVALSVIAGLSILFGNLLAIGQRNIRRMLGYSSVAHMGYLLVAAIAVWQRQLAAETAGIYLTGYVLSSIGAFGVISVLSDARRRDDQEAVSLHGLFWQRPALAVTMTVMLLSLAGVPMTLGFIGKFYVTMLSVNHHLYWLTAFIVLGSAIGLFYYLSAMAGLYRRSEPVAHNFDTPRRTAACTVLVVCALLTVWLGIWPEPLIQLLHAVSPTL